LERFEDLLDSVTESDTLVLVTESSVALVGFTMIIDYCGGSRRLFWWAELAGELFESISCSSGLRG
jgi:hypothetical protein